VYDAGSRRPDNAGEVTRAGALQVLQVQTAPVPVPGRGQLVVRMQAAGVAFGDVTQRQGRNPGKLPAVLGYDVVGTVRAVGPRGRGGHGETLTAKPPLDDSPAGRCPIDS